jgi:hypothetical protein
MTIKEANIAVRVAFLKAADEDLRNTLEDEDDFMTWLMLGVPDCADDDILEFMASDDEIFYKVLNLYYHLKGVEEYD